MKTQNITRSQSPITNHYSALTTLPLWHGFLLILLVHICCALMPAAKAVTPAPDGGYPGGNTAEGQTALFSLTTGGYNTAVGYLSLRSDTTGNFNTAVGAGTLLLNTGDENTATGTAALLSNTTGPGNTASGAFALFSNTTGGFNTAGGDSALFSNTIGGQNTGTGFSALTSNTGGTGNTANGAYALANNITGNDNTATGALALFANTNGIRNTAVGYGALQNHSTGNSNIAVGAGALFSDQTGGSNNALGDAALNNNVSGSGNTALGDFALGDSTGNFNTALGASAGANATTGNNNVYIGAGISGVAGESTHTYIANIRTTTVSGGGADSVTVDLTTGLLGHASSSLRYKEDIKPMDKASEALYGLKPVSYRYKKEIDTSQSLDYGLVAEEVATIDPNLAIRDGKGQIENVRYNAINVMLLNEFLKEHKAFLEDRDKVQQLVANAAKQQKEIEALTAGLQKVSAQLETSKPPLQVVNNP